MLTAICVGLLIWTVFVVIIMVTTKQYEVVRVDQCFLALALILSTSVVIRHFGSMIIGVLT